MSTQLQDTFIGHSLQRYNLIGCSKTRTVGAQSDHVLEQTLMLLNMSDLLLVSE